MTDRERNQGASDPQQRRRQTRSPTSANYIVIPDHDGIRFLRGERTKAYMCERMPQADPRRAYDALEKPGRRKVQNVKRVAQIFGIDYRELLLASSQLEPTMNAVKIDWASVSKRIGAENLSPEALAQRTFHPPRLIRLALRGAFVPRELADDIARALGEPVETLETAQGHFQVPTLKEYESTSIDSSNLALSSPAGVAKTVNSAPSIPHEATSRSNETEDEQLAAALSTAGVALIDAGRADEAERKLTQALELYGGIVNSGKEELRWALASTLNNLGNASLVQGKSTEAIASYASAVQEYASVVATHTEFRHQLAITLKNRAMAHAQLDSWTQAREDSDDAIELFEAAYAEGSREVIRDLCNALRHRATVRQALKDHDGAARDLDRVVQVRSSGAN